MIEKGYVSSVLEGGKKVTVIPAFSADVVSHAMTVPFYLIGCLGVNTEVAYCSFADNTGVVLSRLDGEWNHRFTGDLELTGTVKAATVYDGTVRLGTHTHTDSEGGSTTAPR